MFVSNPDVTTRTPRGQAPEGAGSVTVAADRAEGAGSLHLRGGLHRPLRVAILGMRGFPNVQGGVEKHTEKLACELTALGCDVQAIVRSWHVPKVQRSWRRIKFARLWAPHTKGAETFIHTFLGVLYAGVKRPDILHIHGIGPALFTPLARALGLRVVVTHHVLNYENEKWGPVARWTLRLGEWAGMKFANSRIAVSEALARQATQAHRVPVIAIPNGIEEPRVMRSRATLEAFGLSVKNYIVSVARIDEQKRQLDLIAAYARLRNPQWKLALVGDADFSGAYARNVAAAAQKTPGVVLLGHQSGVALAELYSHAGAFVLPSSHEGQPIAVLEAASYGLPLILSDIAAHREIAIPEARYFAVGDVAMLQHHLAAVFAKPPQKLSAIVLRQLVAAHDWRHIAERTLGIYFGALPGRSNTQTAASYES
jgi:glycosyltransferase involved in cell wall biosynthesis